MSEMPHTDLNDTTLTFMEGHLWMVQEMKMFDFDTDKMAVPNFRQILHKIVDNLDSAKANKRAFKRLRGVEGVCI